MYYCSICSRLTEPREPRKVYTIHRIKVERKAVLDIVDGVKKLKDVPRKEIAAEYPICTKCNQGLESGKSIKELLEEHSVSVPRCVVCSQDASNGQITDGGVLCDVCIEKIRRRMINPPKYRGK